MLFYHDIMIMYFYCWGKNNGMTAYFNCSNNRTRQSTLCIFFKFFFLQIYKCYYMFLKKKTKKQFCNTMTNILKEFYPRGGLSCENGLQVHATLKIPFSHPPGCFWRLHLRILSSSGPYISLKSQHFGKFAFQSPKIREKFQFLILKFCQISALRASILDPPKNG